MLVGSPVCHGSIKRMWEVGCGFYLHGKVPDSIVFGQSQGPSIRPFKGIPAPDANEADRSSDCVRRVWI